MKKILSIVSMVLFVSLFSASLLFAASIQEIKKRGEIIVLTGTSYPPFEYVATGGVYEGVDIELARAVAKKLGVKVQVVPLPFRTLIEALNSGKGDFIAASLSITDERKAVVDFTVPYVDNKLFIFCSCLHVELNPRFNLAFATLIFSSQLFNSSVDVAKQFFIALFNGNSHIIFIGKAFK
ncbi:amino acid ABC transporter substrate-binding protein [Deferribacterales bacterium RsTz2092]